MGSDNYWLRKPISRRIALRSFGVGAMGLAGAALLGCGGGSSGPAASSGGSTAGATATVAASNSFSNTGLTGTGDVIAVPTPAGKVSADQVRVKPGSYIGVAPMSPAETDPMVNARYGGTLHNRYLDPPQMDFNRVLSCTINVTMDYTKNKLVRGVFGPRANPALIQIEPDLAQNWEISPDGLQYTFHLNKGVKFHTRVRDGVTAPGSIQTLFGREFNSEDAKLSVERYKAGGVQQDVWSPVASIETPDAYTLKLTLTEPLADFPRNIAAWSHMDGKELLGEPDFLKQASVGTGPFMQQEWTPKERSVFIRNPDYFEKGLPFLDKIISVVQDDTAVWRAGYQTDNFVEWSALDDPDAAEMLKSNGKDAVFTKLTTAQGVNTTGFHFQMKNPKWQDVRVRRAFSLAMDRVEFDLARYAGEGKGYSKGPIPWQSLYTELPTLQSQGPWYQYDLAQARQLLQAAGYTADKPVVADAPVWYGRNEYQQIIKPQYDKVPELKFNIRVVDNPTAVQMLNDRNYDDTMNVTWGPPSYSVDQVTYPWYYSKGGVNHANVNDAEMDRLLIAQRRESKPEVQKDLWKQIEARYFDQVWQVFYPVGIFTRSFFHNYMLNFRYHGIGGYTCYVNGQARSVWLDAGAPA